MAEERAKAYLKEAELTLESAQAILERAKRTSAPTERGPTTDDVVGAETVNPGSGPPTQQEVAA